MSEMWRPIPAFPVYSVSSLGRVRNEVARRGTYAGRILRPYGLGRYPGVSLFTGGGVGVVKMYVHQVVAAAFLGPCPIGKEVNHKNGEKWDARATNLEYVTRGENARHAYRIGLKDSRGERNGHALLTEVQARQIRARYAAGESQRGLARVFGATRAAVASLVQGRSWRYLGGRVVRYRVPAKAPNAVKAEIRPRRRR